MPIWTTPQMQEQLQLKELPLRVLSPNEIKTAFLAQSAPEDIAILGINDEYLEFLAAVKERGIQCPVLFISPEPTITEPDLLRFNALVLDLKKMGLTSVRNIVQVILRLAARQGGVYAPGISFDAATAGRADEGSVEDAKVVRERLAFIHKKEIPAMISFEVRENGNPVMARGLCSIKDIRDDALVFHRFKQSMLVKSLKKGQFITVYVTYKQKNYGAVVTVLNTTDKELVASLPTKLFYTREMRIQPNLSKPVGLYVLIPNEPTTNLQVLDISPRGIGFLCPRDLPIDAVYGLTITLPDPQSIVVTSGAIRFKKESSNGIRYGAEMHPHPWDEESIAKYIMKRETEIIGLLRNM